MSGTLGPAFLLGGMRLQAGQASFVDRTALPIVQPSERPPARMGSADWTLVDTGAGGTLRLEILTAPDPRGAPITGYDYRLGTGVWRPTDRSTPGTLEIDGLPDGTPVSVTLRAVNAVGAGLASAPLIATPTGAVTGFVLESMVGAIAIQSRSDPAAPIARGDVTFLQITG